VTETTVAQGPDVCDICLQPIRRGDLIVTITEYVVRDGLEVVVNEDVVHDYCDPTTEETA
jgi:hypothetical protein